MYNFKNKILLGAVVFIAGIGCSNLKKSETPVPAKEQAKFAFLADVHFHDVYSEFEDESFKGILNPVNGRYATIRTMESQLNSTRLFNENYFAFIAALDDIAEKNIKNVILPGDFSDDGQPMNIKGLVKIMEEYSELYGFRYYAALGNHDPVRPYTRPGGKNDFLGEGGLRQPIYSHPETYKPKGEGELSVIATDEVAYLGYEEIMKTMKEYGFYPKEDDLYWESPFSSYTNKNYSYKQALEESHFENRIYEIYTQGSGGKYAEVEYTNPLMVPDSSYLVEPVEGVWLLSIDANVFVPKDEISEDNNDPDNYNSPSNAGYNKVITHKEFLIDWIKKVSEEAKEQDKTLIAFSHYPLVDFYNDAAEDIEEVFGDGKLDLKRVPGKITSKIFADAGIKLHFGGHMHFNDTSVRHYDDSFIVNVQVPSLAAYIPAYKILSLGDGDSVEVETIVLDEVPRFNELFELYQLEYDYLESREYEGVWNNEVLEAESYFELNDWHIRELARLRFLPREWPEDVKNMILNLSGIDMLTLTQMNTSTKVGESNFDIENIKDEEFKKEFQNARNRALLIAKSNGFTEEDLSSWNGFDLVTDFYKLRNADQLALKDVSPDKISQYRLIGKSIDINGINLELDQNMEVNNIEEVFKLRFEGILKILNKFTEGYPSINFEIDMTNGSINEI